MQKKYYYVYILASKKDGILYITSDLVGRTWQHKESVVKGFTEKYWVKRLVYYEIHEDVQQAFYAKNNLKNGIALENTINRRKKSQMERFIFRDNIVKRSPPLRG